VAVLAENEPLAEPATYEAATTLAVGETVKAGRRVSVRRVE
jgi:hypothetical protein